MILAAAAAYFAIVFAAGFALGTVRVLLVEPRLGPLAATSIELPSMLLISWMAAGWVVRTFKVAATASARLTVGLLAFVFLIGAEIMLGVGAFGRTLAAQAAEMSSPKGLLGLAGQVVFALFPAAMLLRSESK